MPPRLFFYSRSGRKPPLLGAWKASALAWTNFNDLLINKASIPGCSDGFALERLTERESAPRPLNFDPPRVMEDTALTVRIIFFDCFIARSFRSVSGE